MRKPQYQRRAKSITDYEVLMLINFGELKVTDLENRQPTVVHRGNVLTPSLMGRPGRERFKVEIWRGGVRRSISMNKLVWMFVNRKLVPDDEQVHHLDEDRQNDAASNLESKTVEDHYAAHYGEF